MRADSLSNTADTESFPTDLELGKLVNLKSLNLDGNNFNAVPSSVLSLSNLEDLSLRDCKLQSIPSTIGNLAKLKRLDISSSVGAGSSRNSLKSVPSEIGDLVCLEELGLADTQLAGLPSHIGQLKKLRRLFLQRNKLTLDSIPSEIGKLSNLQLLNLSENRLGFVPSAIWTLESLVELWLANSQITSVPPLVGHLKNLRRLVLSRNKLDRLPGEVGQLANLESLNLNNTGLASLPPEIGRLVKLRILDLSSNRFGSVPPEVTLLTSLQELHVQNNAVAVLKKEDRNHAPHWGEMYLSRPKPRHPVMVALESTDIVKFMADRNIPVDLALLPLSRFQLYSDPAVGSALNDELLKKMQEYRRAALDQTSEAPVGAPVAGELDTMPAATEPEAPSSASEPAPWDATGAACSMPQPPSTPIATGVDGTPAIASRGEPDDSSLPTAHVGTATRIEPNVGGAAERAGTGAPQAAARSQPERDAENDANASVDRGDAVVEKDPVAHWTRTVEIGRELLIRFKQALLDDPTPCGLFRQLEEGAHTLDGGAHLQLALDDCFLRFLSEVDPTITQLVHLRFCTPTGTKSKMPGSTLAEGEQRGPLGVPHLCKVLVLLEAAQETRSGNDDADSQLEDALHKLAKLVELRAEILLRRTAASMGSLAFSNDKEANAIDPLLQLNESDCALAHELVHQKLLRISVDISIFILQKWQRQAQSHALRLTGPPDYEGQLKDFRRQINKINKIIGAHRTNLSKESTALTDLQKSVPKPTKPILTLMKSLEKKIGKIQDKISKAQQDKARLEADAAAIAVRTRSGTGIGASTSAPSSAAQSAARAPGAGTSQATPSVNAANVASANANSKKRQLEGQNGEAIAGETPAKKPALNESTSRVVQVKGKAERKQHAQENAAPAVASQPAAADGVPSGSSSHLTSIVNAAPAAGATQLHDLSQNDAVDSNEKKANRETRLESFQLGIYLDPELAGTVNQVYKTVGTHDLCLRSSADASERKLRKDPSNEKRHLSFSATDLLGVLRKQLGNPSALDKLEAKDIVLEPYSFLCKWPESKHCSWRSRPDENGLFHRVGTHRNPKTWFFPGEKYRLTTQAKLGDKDSSVTPVNKLVRCPAVDAGLIQPGERLHWSDHDKLTHIAQNGRRYPALINTDMTDFLVPCTQEEWNLRFPSCPDADGGGSFDPPGDLKDWIAVLNKPNPDVISLYRSFNGETVVSAMARLGPETKDKILNAALHGQIVANLGYAPLPREDLQRRVLAELARCVYIKNITQSGWGGRASLLPGGVPAANPAFDIHEGVERALAVAEECEDFQKVLEVWERWRKKRAGDPSDEKNPIQQLRDRWIWNRDARAPTSGPSPAEASGTSPDLEQASDEQPPTAVPPAPGPSSTSPRERFVLPQTWAELEKMARGKGVYQEKAKRIIQAFTSACDSTDKKEDVRKAVYSKFIAWANRSKELLVRHELDMTWDDLGKQMGFSTEMTAPVSCLW
eukprot:tig00020801_g13935.t1